MLDITTSTELKEKKRLLKKAKKLSTVSRDDINGMEGPSRSVSSAQTAEGGPSGQSADRSLPQIHESLGTMTDTSSASSEADSQSAILSTPNPPPTEQLRKGKVSRSNRQENMPPSIRRQSLDLSSRGSSVHDLKRSTSLWAQRQAVVNDAAGEFQDRYLRNFGTGTMSDRRRTLNVKRARKMAQLFGQEPPSELIQIHDEREIDHFRDSTTTLSTVMTVAPPLRDRPTSVSSTGTMANDLEGDEDVPPTPPPFSTARVTDDADTKSSSFQDRRRRAAKLSRFFGVGFQDISLPPEPEVPIPDARIVEVDVKVSGRRFWSFNDRSKDGDMQEAIHKLRGLKAS
ncbi:hypothetical protein DFH09DRAFT_1068037 [Mycena vulgaris]|nr:hypothetical protein DFH09DRAFT_1068037 [Mycena vulgaris]